MSLRVAAAVLAVVAVLGLAACSAPGADSPAATSGDAPGDGGQTTAEACQLIQDTIESATNEFQQTSADDPAAVVEAMKTAAQSLADSASDITNDEVAALVPQLQSMFEQLGEVMSAVAQGDATKAGAIGELSKNFRETSETFQQLCRV